MHAQVQLGNVLALWVFLHPTILRRVNVWLQAHGFKDGLAGASARLKKQQLQKLREDMGMIPGTSTPYVAIVKQGHGEMVHVPAGWVHQVINMRPCIKMAWDVYQPKHLLNYVLSQQYVASQITSTSNSADDMSVMRIIENLVVELRMQ